MSRKAFSQGAKKGSSELVAAGICHFCMAGTDGYPYADMSDEPAFLRTMQSAAALCPWHEVSPFTAKLPSYTDMPQMIYRPDIWHNWHLGHGKYFLSSALVCLLGLFAAAGRGVVPRMAAMSRLWLAYCRRVKIKVYEGKPGPHHGDGLAGGGVAKGQHHNAPHGVDGALADLSRLRGPGGG